MNPEIYDLGSKLLFWGVTWGTAGLVAFAQLKGLRRMRRGALATRRQETRRYYQKFQQLRLAMLRASYPELEPRWQRHWLPFKRRRQSALHAGPTTPAGKTTTLAGNHTVQTGMPLPERRSQLRAA